MRSPKQAFADWKGWRQYDAQLGELDRVLDEMDAAGADRASPEYFEAWCDRMSFAANCYPGAPEAEPEAEL